MKVSALLSLAALSSAFVLPDQDVLAEVEVHVEHTASDVADRLSSGSDLLESIDGHLGSASDKVRQIYRKYKGELHHSLDDALAHVSEHASAATQQLSEAYFDGKAWVETEVEDLTTSDPLAPFEQDEHPAPSLDKDHKGHHGHKHGNSTVYQLISESKYTTKLAKLINDYPDIVEALNTTDAHYTVFAPTDHAFDKIPESAPKPSKDFLEKVLLYHVSPKFYPAGRVLVTRTIPTLLNSDHLAQEPTSQRLGTQISFKGLTVNYYSRIVAVDVFGSNGVIHAVDSIIIPPPSALKIVDLLPTVFSTLELGLAKTGLLEHVNASEHTGGTLFAPSNFAFQKLGPGVNAFLFSPHGLKYLRALLEYHVVANQTLYSDYYLDGRASSPDSSTGKPHHGPPRGYKHFDLETVLEGKSLSIDVARYGRLIDIRINGFSHVIRSDGVADDGVLHEVNSVLIPPHEHGHDIADDTIWSGDGEISVDELVQRLDPYVTKTSKYIPSEL